MVPRKTRANPVHALKLPDQRRLDPAIKALFAKFKEKIGFVPKVSLISAPLDAVLAIFMFGKREHWNGHS